MNKRKFVGEQVLLCFISNFLLERTYLLALLLLPLYSPK